MRELARAAGELHAVAGEQVLGGRWRLIRKLGEGGLGTVWEAEHLVLQSPVAIKFLEGENADDPSQLARFLREARAAASIRDPAIVEVRDLGRADDGRPYLVMELMGGPTLRDLLLHGTPPPADRVRRWMAQAAGALSAAHAAGVIHRDIKPDNLLFTAEGRDVKVSDFGLCIFREQGAARLTGEGRVFGSVHYFAPERIRGDAPTPQSDVYSFGATLFELLTGRPLWDSAIGPSQVCRHHLFTTPPRARDAAPGPPAPPVPDDLDELVVRCLAKAPDDHPTMAEVHAALLGRGAANADERLPAAAPASAWKASPAAPAPAVRSEPTVAVEPDEEALAPPEPGSSSRARWAAALLVLAGATCLIAARRVLG